MRGKMFYFGIVISFVKFFFMILNMVFGTEVFDEYLLKK